MNYPEVTPEEQRDIEDFKRILHFLNEGWSVNSALGRAKVSPARYSDLRKRYESIRDTVDGFKQTYKRKFPNG